VLAPLAFLPVLAFLLLLRVLDSYRLIPGRRILRSVVLGVLAAGVAYVVNRWVIEQLGVSRGEYSRYGAPLVEEAIKFAPVFVMIATSRVGFLVDAAIHGFAIGTGFALLENLNYWLTLEQSDVWLWVLRGFGTAILHGSATAIAAVLGKALSDRYRMVFPLSLPGLFLAATLHSAYNHSPVIGALGVLAGAPLILMAVFQYSERVTRSWLGSGFDSEAELLQLVMSEDLPQSRVGQYLKSLRGAMDGPVLADLLCLLHVQLELSIRAKGILLMREAGIDAPLDNDVREKLEELRFLEKSVGPAGRLALHPILRMSSRDLWQIYMLDRLSPSERAS